MDVQTVSVVIAAISVIIGVINSIRSNQKADAQRQIELKTQELALQTQQQALETRQAELFMQIYNRYNTKDFQKTYGATRFIYKWTDEQDFTQRYHVLSSPENLDAFADYNAMNAFFEGVGVLVKKGLIDVDLVYDLFANRIIWYWEEGFGPLGPYWRARINDPDLYDSMEYLYHEMKQRQQTANVA
jgi:hypothetical protein